jgi:hypothetical protein
MNANLLREEFSVKRIAPFEVATLKYQHRRVRQYTHGLAIKMSLSGEDDYVSIDVVVIVFEASYRWAGRDFVYGFDDCLGVFHSKT